MSLKGTKATGGERFTASAFSILLLATGALLVMTAINLGQFLSDPHQGMMVILAFIITAAVLGGGLVVAFKCAHMAITGRWL